MTMAHIILTILLIAAEAAVVVRALLRPHREPMSRLTWVIVIIIAPVLGMVAYLLFGEARVSVKRWKRGREIDWQLPRPPEDQATIRALADSPHGAPFALARSVNRLGPTACNRAHLAADSNVAIDEMVADVDAAKETIHALFYIWLDDHNGLKLKDAFLRAAARGIEVRVLADGLGSRDLIRSSHWENMKRGGVQLRVSLPIGNVMVRMVRGRVDVRNHRKLMVVDNKIAWCGSQNAADPEFRVKPRYAPWVDIMTRWEGPVARVCQLWFVGDWMNEGGEDLGDLLTAAAPIGRGTATAQVIGTGPTLRFDAMPTCFTELIHSARNELVITTPYFVPDEQLLFGLISAGRRGVTTILMLPKKNDSRIVAAVSKSYYRDLLEAGVQIFEYHCGLLHAKTMVVDRAVGLIGSANLDRRSFELNFENNMLFADTAFAETVRARQEQFLGDCDPVDEARVARFTFVERIVQNFLAMLSPLL
jgi:cardiolipin synthase